VHALTVERRWPDSTRHISELRLAIEFQSAVGSKRDRSLTLDIVDYPGEWLLDLPLLAMSYEEWSAETLRLARQAPRDGLSAHWREYLEKLRPQDHADEQQALAAARLFTEYLRACRQERYALSLLPPGRFLMPGDLAGSPALTFAPLELRASDRPERNSLHAMMSHRFEAYKAIVVRPFFREHFARLDRQIVLVDALAAFNAGPAAIGDLERALTAILGAFRTGRKSLASALVRPRIDRILFAATKADHLHHVNHDRLERILARMTERAIARAKFAGALVDVVALAAVRATREATITRGRDRLPAIVGVPIAGESAGDETFDGATEIAVFPGDLPDNPEALFSGEAKFKGLSAVSPGNADYRFVRFRPPAPASDSELPHIRLDRALQFLIGDRLK
jgi:predicted YcjX-like family ATPase